LFWRSVLLQGVVIQILHHRLKVAPPNAKALVADTGQMPIKGVSVATLSAS